LRITEAATIGEAMRRAAETMTERRIAGLRLERGRTVRDLRDAAAPGLLFRVRASGWRGFLFTYTAPGGGERRAIVLGRHGDRPPGLTLAAARLRAGELAAAVAAGRDPLDAKAEARAGARAARRARREAEAERRALEAGEPVPGSFAHLAHSYLRDHARKRKRTWREDERKLERDLLPAWGRRPAGSITRGDVHALVYGIAAGEGSRAHAGRPAPLAANRTLALVSRIYSYAVNAEYAGVASNPAYRLPRPGVERPRSRVLSDAEIRALWQATGEELLIPRAALRLLLLTGLRRGELLGARWRDVAADEMGTWLEIPGERTKNGRPLRAPLSSLAREILAQLAEARDPERLFPGLREGRSLYDLNGPMERLRARVAKIAGTDPEAPAWTIHDLRRTFRTKLGELRVPFGIAERCLGHVAPDARGVPGIYDRHTYADERMAAVEALARLVRQILSGERANVLPFFQREAGVDRA